MGRSRGCISCKICDSTRTDQGMLEDFYEFLEPGTASTLPGPVEIPWELRTWPRKVTFWRNTYFSQVHSHSRILQSLQDLT
jgi:hypothetical protein